MKLCKDCKNYYVIQRKFSTYEETDHCCNRPVIEEKFNLIIGNSTETKMLWLNCLNERKNKEDNKNVCGEEGKYWEAK